MSHATSDIDGAKVAIVGMACRVPGAGNLDEFWRNLLDGKDSITRFDALDQEVPATLRAAGENRVLANGAVDGIDLFDAGLFGFSHQEAAITDPQHRLALEVGWQCLMDAGCDPQRFAGDIGVFSSASFSTYLVNQLLPDFERALVIGGTPLILRNDKDHLATLLAYKLGLTGPAINIGCGCSGSLAAVHTGIQSLLTWQCDLAVCGGVSLLVPQLQGHLRQPDGIYSDDGYCRVFDQAATGTVGGGGVGFVALKRLQDAVDDGDEIYAVIAGSAINNDGRKKAGYTAPSIDRQTDVISMAHAVAGVSADDIGMIEAHGTGTALGDAVEVEALTRAFRASTSATGFCAIGSVKSNIGHLDVASGVIGLVKVALALRRRTIPATLHCSTPNPELDLERSPFYPISRSADWQPRGGVRRAGVSSFGMGGTNVHVVCEERPEPSPCRPWSGGPFIFPLSGHNDESLRTACRRLASRLDDYRDLGALAVSLAVGRPAQRARAAVIAADRAQLALELNRQASRESGGRRPRVLLALGGASGSHEEFTARLERFAPGSLDDLHRLAATFGNTETLPPRGAGVGMGLIHLAFGRWLRRIGVPVDAIAADRPVLPTALALSAAVGEDALLDWLAGPRQEAQDPMDGLVERPGDIDILVPAANDAAGPSGWTRVLAGAHSSAGGEWTVEDYVIDVGDLVGDSTTGPVGDAPRTICVGTGSEAHQHNWVTLLAALWGVGADVDWRLYYGERSRHRCRLPDYAFTRQRHWFEPRADNPLPSTEGLQTALAARCAALESERNITPIAAQAELKSDLDAFCIRLMRRPFDLHLAPGETVRRDEVATRLGVHARWLAFFDYVIDTLVRLEVLDAGATHLRLVGPPSPGPDATALALRHSSFGKLFRLIEELAGDLDVKLSDPLLGSTQFRAAMLEKRLAAALAEPQPQHSNLECCCRLGVDLIARLARSKPKLRVLEVGAGGLVFTQFALDLIGGDRVEYWATDIDPQQVDEARRQAEARGLTGLRTAVLDVQRPLREQGIGDKTFDVVIGLNVVHVCPDVVGALANLRTALAPDGYLLLIETVDQAPWYSLIWGWAEGWWNFAAPASSRHAPLLSSAAWQSALASLGPSTIATFPTLGGAEAETVLLVASFAARQEEVPAGDASQYPRKDSDPARWLYRPFYIRHRIDALRPGEVAQAWIVLGSPASLIDPMLASLRRRHCRIIVVEAGDAFRQTGDDRYSARPGSADDLTMLLDGLTNLPDRVGVLHLWSLDTAADSSSCRRLGLYSLLACAQAICDGRGRSWHLVSVVRGLCDVLGTEDLEPHHSLVQAAMKIIPREYAGIRCQVVDCLDTRPIGDEVCDSLFRLLSSPDAPALASWSGGHYWVAEHRQIDPPLGQSRLKERGVYVVFGGLGGVGYAVARRLAEQFSARLLLVGRRVDADRRLVADKLAGLEALGGSAAALRADLSVPADVEAALAEAERRYGAIDGVIHSAGEIDRGGVIQNRSFAATDEALAAKVDGALHLAAALEHRPVDFLVLFSSIGSQLYRLKFGEVGYVAGNDFLSAFALARHRRPGRFTQVIHWTDWEQDGMWTRARAGIDRDYAASAKGGDISILEREVVAAMTDVEGTDAFLQIMRLDEPCVVVSPQPLDALLRLHEAFEPEAYGRLLDSSSLVRKRLRDSASDDVRDRRPDRQTCEVTALDSLSAIQSIWEDVLGCHVGDSDDFFVLGGDSLLALRVVAQVSERFGVNLPLSAFFTQSKLSDMAVYVDNLRWVAADAEQGV